MSNYKEQALTGQEWQRSFRVTITNPYGSTPAIVFDEEKIALLDNGLKVNTPVGQLRGEMANPLAEFPLVHPETGASLGSAQYANLHVLLYSLYLHLAGLRDLG